LQQRKLNRSLEKTFAACLKNVASPEGGTLRRRRSATTIKLMTIPLGPGNKKPGAEISAPG
jgi:hypothetical protein